MTVITSVDPASQRDETESPAWLRPLVKSGRFYRQCESHHSRVCNLYCMGCMGAAICPECKNQHKKAGCKVLTAYKASREAALRAVDVKPIWDALDICFYIINRKKIVFIQKKGEEGRTGHGQGEDRCLNCSYKIRSPNKYCSIECKLEFLKERRDLNPAEMKTMEEANAGVESSPAEPVTPESYRKRPRKGRPRRALFF